MNTSTTLPLSWQWGARSLYDSQLWYYGLLAAGSLSNILYYCTVPIVGIGVLAGTTTIPILAELLLANALWGIGLAIVHWGLVQHLRWQNAPSD
ncbi:MAG: hypothetical protein AB4050_03670 [Synechococcus sp.]